MKKSVIINYIRLISVKGDKFEYMVIFRGKECLGLVIIYIGFLRICDLWRDKKWVFCGIFFNF